MPDSPPPAALAIPGQVTLNPQGLTRKKDAHDESRALARMAAALEEVGLTPEAVQEAREVLRLAAGVLRSRDRREFREASGGDDLDTMLALYLMMDRATRRAFGMPETDREFEKAYGLSRNWVYTRKRSATFNREHMAGMVLDRVRERLTAWLDNLDRQLSETNASAALYTLGFKLAQLIRDDDSSPDGTSATGGLAETTHEEIAEGTVRRLMAQPSMRRLVERLGGGDLAEKMVEADVKAAFIESMTPTVRQRLSGKKQDAVETTGVDAPYGGGTWEVEDAEVIVDGG